MKRVAQVSNILFFTCSRECQKSSKENFRIRVNDRVVFRLYLEVGQPSLMHMIPISNWNLNLFYSKTITTVNSVNIKTYLSRSELGKRARENQLDQHSCISAAETKVKTIYIRRSLRLGRLMDSWHFLLPLAETRNKRDTSLIAWGTFQTDNSVCPPRTKKLQ